MGFWKKLAKVGMIAAPIAATIATGGAASPWLATTLGAASGAGSSLLDHPKNWKGALMGAGIGAGTGLLGAKIGGGGGMSGVRDEVNGVANAATKAAMGKGAGSSLLGSVGSFIEKHPTAALAGLSLLGGIGGDGGGGGAQTRRGFDPKGFSNPEDAMNRAGMAIHRAGQAFSERPNVTLRGVRPRQATPVNIAGMQIGGGLGWDPSMSADYEVDRSQAGKYDPFQSVGGVEDFRKKRSV